MSRNLKKTPSTTEPDMQPELPESIQSLRTLIFENCGDTLEVQLRMFIACVRDGSDEKLPKAYYTDIIIDLISQQNGVLIDSLLEKMPKMATQSQPSLMSTARWPPINEVEAYNMALDRVTAMLEEAKALPSNS